MRTFVAIAGFVLIIVFFLGTEHRAHLFGVLPFLLLLACPLLHLFMHSGHSGHGRGQPGNTDPRTGHEGHGGSRP